MKQKTTDPIPSVVFPAVRIPQPDGSILFKPGKPVVQEQNIDSIKAAKILGLSQRHIESQCQIGLFATAYKPGGRPRSKWKISLAEVMARLEPPRD